MKIFDENNVDPFAKKTLKYHLHEIGFIRRDQRKKMLIKKSIEKDCHGAGKSGDGRLKQLLKNYIFKLQ